MLRRFAFTTAVFFVLGLGVLAGPALADTVIGQTVTSGASCVPSGWVGFDVGAPVSYTVPAGGGTITSWSTQAGPDSGTQLALVVVRPLGGSQYKVVAISATETLTPSVINTFPVSISVQGGDVIGAWVVNDSYVCDVTSDPGDPLLFEFTTPTVGATLTTSLDPGVLMNISATLVLAGAAVPQVNNVFLCYSKFEQDGGAVFNVNEEDVLLKSGAFWTPDAVAGNVTGGDNIGAYHLACNPPSSLTSTGQLLDDGGNVIPASAMGIDSTDGLYPIFG